MNKFWKHVFCGGFSFLWKKHFMKVVCAVWRSFLSCVQKVFVEGMSLFWFFWGAQFVQSKVCFCKGYLSFIKFIQSSKRLSICAPCWGCFWSVYLCTMRGCFWSVYLCTMLRLLLICVFVHHAEVAFDLCILLFDLCTILEGTTDVNSVGHQPLLLCMRKSGCLWLCQSIRNFGITTNKVSTKLFVKGDNGITDITSEFHTFGSFFLALFSPVTIILVWIILVCFWAIIVF
jgi:hypothetical protein